MCKQCETKPVYEFTNKRKLCKNCYVRWFEKKFLYTIRKFQMIKKNDIIYLPKKQNLKSVVLRSLLEMFIQKAPVTLSSERYTKKVLTSNLDSESLIMINALFNETPKEIKLNPVNKKEIKPLYLFLDKEILIYANIKKLKYKEETKKPTKLKQFIDNLEIKHPEIKRGIINSYLELF